MGGVKNILDRHNSNFVSLANVLEKIANAKGVSTKDAARALSGLLKEPGKHPEWMVKTVLPGICTSTLPAQNNEKQAVQWVLDTATKIESDAILQATNLEERYSLESIGFRFNKIYPFLKQHGIDLELDTPALAGTASAALAPQEAILDAAQEGDWPLVSGGHDAAGMDGAENDAAIQQDETLPAGIPTGMMAHALNGLNNWGRDAWRKKLADPPGWLKSERLTRGKPGNNHPATWNPVDIAVAIREKYRIPLAKLDTMFAGNDIQDWKRRWGIVREHLDTE